MQDEVNTKIVAIMIKGGKIAAEVEAQSCPRAWVAPVSDGLRRNRKWQTKQYWRT